MVISLLANKQNGSSRSDSPLERQLRLVFVASTTCPMSLFEAHACPVQHHVGDDAEAVRVDLHAKENDLVIDLHRIQ
jgi:hypothetical protein